jgi:hypothetical protein
MHYDEVLEPRFLFDQILGESDGAGRRTGTPFPHHPLDANDPGLDFQTL